MIERKCEFVRLARILIWCKQDRKTCDKVTRLHAYFSGLELVLYTVEKQSKVVVKITVPEAKMPGFKFQLHHLQAAPA